VETKWTRRGDDGLIEGSYKTRGGKAVWSWRWDCRFLINVHPSFDLGSDGVWGWCVHGEGCWGWRAGQSHILAIRTGV
jgi:hypothetical protein